ncbi:hypothetical protein BSKO_05877 [Bryopsis sp. KO-2023]|nr:hypothetical protein BSKO_05877 [Bryopsis sp. KO-2023]
MNSPNCVCLLVAILVFGAFTTTEAGGDPVTKALNNPDLISTVSSEQIAFSLNEAIQSGNIFRGSRILSAFNDVMALASGLRFDDFWRQKFLMKSADRLKDGDVVTMKAIARAARDDVGQANKLAAVIVVATLFRHDSVVESELVPVLSNSTLMNQILFSDPTTQFLPEEDIIEQELRESTSTNAGGRRLMCDACTPVDSWVCAHCWPRNICIKIAWCKAAAAEGRKKRNRGG